MNVRFLAVISILCCLALFEIYLRITVKNPGEEIDVGIAYSTELNTLRYQRSFVQQYSTVKEWKRGSYDPYLGWDENIEKGRIRGNRIYSYRPNEDVFRILTIGNSFTYGVEVEDNETYPFYLETLLDKSEALNMAVGGYGIDQSALKYLKYGSKYKADLLIFGVHTANYVRTSVSFFGFNKPTFKYNPEKDIIELTNTHSPSPEDVYKELERTAGTYKFYSYAFFKNRLIRAYWKFINPSFKEKYYQDTDLIVEHILKRLVDSTQSTNTRLLIIQIPLGGRLIDEKTLARAREDEAYRHLLKIYKKLDIPYIDLLEEFATNYPKEKVINEFYLPRGKVSRGHFAPQGNMEVARIIVNKMKDLSLNRWSDEEFKAVLARSIIER